MNESKIEYTTNGVNVVDRDNIRDTETSEKVPINTPQISEEIPIKINKQRFNSRSITKKTSPNIYVNDGTEFVFPNSAITVDFNKTFTATKVVLCFKLDYASQINEIVILGKTA